MWRCVQRSDDVDGAGGERGLRLAGGVPAHDDGGGSGGHDPLDGLEAALEEVEVEQHGGRAALEHQALRGLGVPGDAGDLEARAGHEALELVGPGCGRDHHDGDRRARDGACDVHRRHVASVPRQRGAATFPAPGRPLGGFPRSVVAQGGRLEVRTSRQCRTKVTAVELILPFFAVSV